MLAVTCRTLSDRISLTRKVPGEISYTTMSHQKYHKNSLSTLTAGASFLVALLLAGCFSQERVENTGQLAKEIKASRIKRITPAEMADILNSAGQKLVAHAEKSLSGTVGDNNPCGEGLEVAEASQYGADISLLFAIDTTNSKLDRKEVELLSAYAYQHRNSAPLTESLQKLNDTLTVFYAPVNPASQLFEKCDRAAKSSFALWRVVLNQKTVIRGLE